MNTCQHHEPIQVSIEITKTAECGAINGFITQHGNGTLENEKKVNRNRMRRNKSNMKRAEKTRLDAEIIRVKGELLDLEWLRFLDHSAQPNKPISPFVWLLQRRTFT